MESGALAAQATIERITRDLLDAVVRNEAEIDSDPQLLYRLIDEILLPSFDFLAMTRLAMGKNWRSASRAQRAELVEQFRRLLVSTYGSALLDYSGEAIDYLPMRQSSRPGRATVRARLTLEEGQSLLIAYRLQQKEGRWWIFDVAIDGVSLLTNYRATFANVIRSRGVDGLLEELRLHNQALDRRFPESDAP